MQAITRAVKVEALKPWSMVEIRYLPYVVRRALGRNA
jgi:hypothetical protein